MDLETSDFANAQILEFAGIIYDDNLKKPIQAYSQYFRLDQTMGTDITPGALSAHGLFRQKLCGLSNITFREYIGSLKKIFGYVNALGGHNINFDLGIIFNYNDKELNDIMRTKEKIDTYTDFIHVFGLQSVIKSVPNLVGPKLEEGVSYLFNHGIDRKEFREEYERLFNIKDGKYHSATYDAFCSCKMYQYQDR